MKQTIDWEKVKTDYIRENLRPDKEESFSLKQLSVRWKIAYKTIRNMASKEKWNQHLQDKIAEQNSKVIEKIQDNEIINEVEIRLRQASIARKLQEKAIRRLESVSPEKLSIKEAIELVKLGMVEERKALGLPDKHEITQVINGEFPSVEQSINSHRRIELIAVRLMDFIDKSKQPND